MIQAQALSILKTGVNVFLTGEPGSGKTHTVNQYIAYLRDHRIGVAITASTGIAATHIGGTTIHSWSGIGIRKELSEFDLAKLQGNAKLVDRVKRASVLIIDEISMLDANVLSIVNTATKTLREDSRAFGGLQIVFVGDFFQLPPVTKNGETAQFAFESTAWAEANPVTCYLSEQHRQEDAHFASILKSIRNGDPTQVDQILMDGGRIIDVEHTTTRLYSHNIDVDTVNTKRLKMIEGDTHEFQMASKGNNTLVDQLKRGCISPEVLALKVGALVMFTKNNFEKGFVNGTLGKVAGFGEDGLPLVLTREEREIEVETMEWTIDEQDKILASITQIPLRLAWAITVHKSQGMTLDSAIVDLSTAFEYGQGYVAISRVRTLSGLFLLGLNKRALEVHPKIIEVDIIFRQKSFDALNLLKQTSKAELSRKLLEFIKNCDGKIHSQKENISTEKYSVNDIKRKYKNAYAPWTELDERYILERHSLGENIYKIASFLGRQPSSIRSRLSKLGVW